MVSMEILDVFYVLLSIKIIREANKLEKSIELREQKIIIIF